MKPIHFKESNAIFAKNQPQYQPLPAYYEKTKAEGNTGKVVICWKLTLLERVTLLLIGKIWQQILTFNEPLQPQKLTTKKPKL